MRHFRRSDDTSHEHWAGKHKFEHWYRDNSVYFITARCRHRFPAFESELAKSIFWQQFEKVVALVGFQPWVTSLLDNHYHTVGYLERGESLRNMMHSLHGSVAKLVGDLLMSGANGLRIRLPPGKRLVPFWSDSRRKNYMDGCLRDVLQGNRTYRYVRTQALRHGLVQNWQEYAHTRIAVPLEAAIMFAVERKAFMEGVPYQRYEQRKRAGRRV